MFKIYQMGFAKNRKKTDLCCLISCRCGSSSDVTGAPDLVFERCSILHLQFGESVVRVQNIFVACSCYGGASLLILLNTCFVINS